jgi:tyrosyl-tRNA synthetase
MIGDPSGKSQERNLQTQEKIEENLKGIKKSISQILHHSNFELLNNYDWIAPFSFLDFLRDVGKNFRIGPMLAKESVKLRLQSEDGMSFTEFSYQVLQGYDFYHLFKEKGVILQIGGSDQWGNITAGTELIRKLTGGNAFGVTLPLLTRSDGQKFGKSESGTIWLSEEKLPVYEFYQYFVRVADADVIRFLKLLTQVDLKEIQKIEHDMKKDDYVQNNAQKRLAEEVTKLVHGEEGLKKALVATEIAKPGKETELSASNIELLQGEVPFFEQPQEVVVGGKLVDLLVSTKEIGSKGEAKRLIQNGGLYLNNKRVDTDGLEIQESDLIGGKLLLVALGKKKKLVIRVLREIR